jgi:hypothetical protein
MLERCPGIEMARMSGSGATCFGVFSTSSEARDAVRSISRARPRWWGTRNDTAVNRDRCRAFHRKCLPSPTLEHAVKPETENSEQQRLRFADGQD